MTIPLRSVDDDPRIPALSIVLGYGPIMPIVIAALATWLAPHPWPFVATSLGVLWSAAILIFLAGVRRGLAFRTPGGERPVQIATMIWLFVLGIAAFVVPTAVVSLAILVLGYLSVAILDPLAARREEVPAHFARLRPVQMGIAVASQVAMLVWQLTALPTFHAAAM